MLDIQNEDNPKKIKKHSYFDFIKKYFCIPQCRFMTIYDNEVGDTIKISKLINISIPISGDNRIKIKKDNFMENNIFLENNNQKNIAENNKNSSINKKPLIFNSFVYEDSDKNKILTKNNNEMSILKISSFGDSGNMSNLVLVDNSDLSNNISLNLDQNDNEKSFDSESDAVSSDSDSDSDK